MRMRYSLSVSGFALSDSADGPESAISWNEVDVSKFLHVRVQASVPDSVTTLQGRYRKLDADGGGDAAADKDLGVGQRVPGGYFKFVLTHYILEVGTTYLIRVADTFTGDTKCLATDTVETKR